MNHTQGLHSQQTSTQFKTYGRFWSDMFISTLHHRHQNTKWGNIFGRMLFIPPVEFQTWRIYDKEHWNWSGGSWSIFSILKFFNMFGFYSLVHNLHTHTHTHTSFKPSTIGHLPCFIFLSSMEHQFCFLLSLTDWAAVVLLAFARSADLQKNANIIYVTLLVICESYQYSKIYIIYVRLHNQIKWLKRYR